MSLVLAGTKCGRGGVEGNQGKKHLQSRLQGSGKCVFCHIYVCAIRCCVCVYIIVPHIYVCVIDDHLPVSSMCVCQVDLKCKELGSGGYYYPEHLPVLGQ